MSETPIHYCGFLACEALGEKEGRGGEKETSPVTWDCQNRQTNKHKGDRTIMFQFCLKLTFLVSETAFLGQQNGEKKVPNKCKETHFAICDQINSTVLKL